MTDLNDAQDSTTAAPKRVVGRPFKKGVSGNPGGAPKVAADFKARCREFMEAEGWDKLVALAKGNTRDAPRAIELLTGYGYGRPTQPVSGDSAMDPLQIVISRPYAAATTEADPEAG